MLRDVGARLVLSRRQHEPLVAGGGVAFWCVDEPVSAAAAVADAPGWSVDADRSAGDAACIMYTSGSTGRPKGIVVPQRAVVRLVRDTDYLALSPADRIGHLSNVAFDAATFEIWGALLNGACIVGIRARGCAVAGGAGQTLRGNESACSLVTTALFNQVGGEVPAPSPACASCSSAARLSIAGRTRGAARRARPGQLLHVYGPTECTTFATWHEVDRAAPDGADTVPIGRPIGNTTAWVLDAAGVLLPPVGAPGELVLGGDGAGARVPRPARATAERFGPDPVLGRRPARASTAPATACAAAPTVGSSSSAASTSRSSCAAPASSRARSSAACAATPVCDVRWWRCATTPPASRRSWRGSCRSRVLPSAFKRNCGSCCVNRCPPICSLLRCRLFNALPLNRSGKLDRAALPDPVPLHDAASEIAETAGAGGGDIERALQALWRQVLGVPRVGLHDDFFELGGHSLRATQLVSRIRRELDVEMPLRQVFERPTVAGLAAWIRDAGMAERPAATIAAIPRAPRRTAPG